MTDLEGSPLPDGSVDFLESARLRRKFPLPHYRRERMKPVLSFVEGVRVRFSLTVAAIAEVARAPRPGSGQACRTMKPSPPLSPAGSAGEGQRQALVKPQEGEPRKIDT